MQKLKNYHYIKKKEKKEKKRNYKINTTLKRNEQTKLKIKRKP